MSASPPAGAAERLPALAQILHAFFHAMDERRYDDMLALLAPGARWLRQGQWLEGHPAVRSALEARPADSDTRHVLTNSYVSRYTPDSATVEAYMTAYRFATPPPGQPARAAGPLRLNLVSTDFTRNEDGRWCIVEQRLVPALDFSA